jgi:hypothetical protein
MADGVTTAGMVDRADGAGVGISVEQETNNEERIRKDNDNGKSQECFPIGF